MVKDLNNTSPSEFVIKQSYLSLATSIPINGLTKESYQSDANEFAEQIALLSVKIEETAGKLAVMEAEYQKTEEDMKQIIRYSHIEKSTQDVVDTFISKVYAYKDKRVEIEWNFSVDRGCSQAKAT